jgi:hypothetical protein
MDAHYPYEPPPESRGRFDANPSDLQLTGPVVQDYMTGKRPEANLTPERLRSLIDRYDEELLAVDHHVGDLIERVRRQFPNTVIVLSGDHGEEFLEHGNLGHSHALWQELVHVPLVLWAPGIDAARIATQVRLMDVCPTILELSAQGALPGMQGESLLTVVGGLETADRPAPLEVGGDQKPCWQWRGICDGRMALLRREADLPTLHPIPPLAKDEPAERPVWHLYDLASDPLENRPARERPTRRSGSRSSSSAAGTSRLEALLGLKASTIALDPEQAKGSRSSGTAAARKKGIRSRRGGRPGWSPASPGRAGARRSRGHAGAWRAQAGLRQRDGVQVAAEGEERGRERAGGERPAGAAESARKRRRRRRWRRRAARRRRTRR